MGANSNDKSYRKKSGRKQTSKKRHIVRKFLLIVFSIVCLFLIVAGAATISYMNNLPHHEVVEFDDDGNVIPTKQNPSKSKGIIADIGDMLFKPKNVRVNVAMFGVDDDRTRTDVIMIGTFDPDTKEMAILSIPRDTKVTLPKERVAVLKSEGRYVPADGVMKINEVHAYAGKNHNVEYACLQIEELLGIKLDFYIKVDFDGFKYIVDTLGGVEMTIPKGGLYYSDAYQNLYINLKEGTYMLNGDKAVQLVRYRGYSEADLTRIKVQQDFMKELFKQALSRKNIMSNLVEYVYGFFKYIDTNFSVSDVPKYIQYLDDINPENLKTYSLPGVPETNSVSYFIYDKEETKKLVQEIFYNSSTSQSNVKVANSKDKKIEILNGGNVDGLAARKRDSLINLGYNVTSIASYNGAKENQTRIIVPKEGIGEDLKSILNNSRIIVDPSLINDNVDIEIILGLDSQ